MTVPLIREVRIPAAGGAKAIEAAMQATLVSEAAASDAIHYALLKRARNRVLGSGARKGSGMDTGDGEGSDVDSISTCGSHASSSNSINTNINNNNNNNSSSNNNNINNNNNSNSHSNSHSGRDGDVSDEELDGWMSENEENGDAIFATDVGVVERKHEEWVRELPFVTPFYAVKCNPDPHIVAALARRGCGFDCASMAEMKTVIPHLRRSRRERAERIVYANPSRVAKDLVFASGSGVNLCVVDTAAELDKVHSLCASARVLLRIAVPGESAIVSLGSKFGADAGETLALMHRAAELGVDVAGFAFHVGSGSRVTKPWESAIEMCAGLFGVARNLGFRPRIVDIGGGYPGRDFVDTPLAFAEIAVVIREAFAREFKLGAAALRDPPSAGLETPLCADGDTLRVIAEPGRYFVNAASALITRVINKRVVRTVSRGGGNDALDEDRGSDVSSRSESSGSFDADNCSSAGSAHAAASSAAGGGPMMRRESDDAPPEKVLYYVADGVYGTLSSVLFDHAVAVPTPLHAAEVDGRPLAKSTVFGPTCDALDTIAEDVDLPILEIGDWVRFANNGAYTVASATGFNGIEVCKCVYFRSVISDDA